MRLTNSMRDEILADVLTHAFGGEEEKLAKAEGKLATAVYNKTYTKEERDFMEKVGASGLHTRTRIDVYTPAGDGFTWKRLNFYKEAKFYMPARGDVKLQSGDALVTKIEAHLAEEKRLYSVKQEAKAEAQGILNSVTTTKRLIEVWPDVEKFVPKQDPAITNLPAVKLDKINSLLGLPPK